jgi:ribonuclease P protein component
LNDFSIDCLEDSSEGFPRGVRLNNSRDFNRVFRTATVRKGRGALRMSAVPTRMHTARLGLVVGKRALRRAHDRNRAKRVLRDTFRRRREALPPMDIIILVTGDAGNRAYREALEALLSELQAN